MEQLGLLLSMVLVAVLLIWVLYQRRQVQRYREMNQRIQKEKESVINLMDNIGERMTSKIDLNETLEVIAQYVVDATRAESGAIFLINDQEQTLRAEVVVGLFPPLFEDSDIPAAKHKYLAENIRNHKIKIGEGIIGLVARQDEPLLITDAEADPRVPRAASQLFPIHSMVLCPLRVRGRNLGVLVIVNKQGGAIFDSRDTFLLNGLADQAAVTVELVKLHAVLADQQRLEQELEIARGFQGMLLPKQCPKIPGYEFSALSNAALVVGGDFYDFFPVSPDHLGIVIGDVSGKGIPGALIMAMVRSVLRAEARDTLSPKTVLRRVNERVLADTKDAVYVTMTYGILDTTNQRFRFARAGHEPTLLRHEGSDSQARMIQPEGAAVGLVPPEIFDRIEEAEVQLEPGDMVLLYTDGAVEAVDSANEEYGRDRLIKRFTEKAEASPTELLDTLSADIDQFAKGIPQHDDITLVAFQVCHEKAEEAGLQEAHPIEAPEKQMA